MPLINVLPGAGKTGNVMSPLIPFNVIVDTDVGLLSLILKEYMDPSVFNKDFFFDKTVSQLVYDLYTRKEENPILLCIKDEYKDYADDYYNQFMEREYQKILNKSVVTEFYRLVRLYNNESEIRLTIVCEREEEIEELRKLDNTKSCNIELSKDLNPRLLKTYNQFFFKSIGDIIPYTKYLLNKTIYIANYGFNISENGGFVSNPLIDLLSNNNRLNVIDVYNMKRLKGE